MSNQSGRPRYFVRQVQEVMLFAIPLPEEAASTSSTTPRMATNLPGQSTTLPTTSSSHSSQAAGSKLPNSSGSCSSIPWSILMTDRSSTLRTIPLNTRLNVIWLSHIETTNLRTGSPLPVQSILVLITEVGTMQVFCWQDDQLSGLFIRPCILANVILIQDMATDNNITVSFNIVDNSYIESDAQTNKYLQLFINKIPIYMYIKILTSVKCNICNEEMDLYCNYLRYEESYLYDAQKGQMVFPYMNNNTVKLGHQKCMWTINKGLYLFITQKNTVIEINDP